MPNFKVLNQTPREIKMFFRLLQPIIVISTKKSDSEKKFKNIRNERLKSIHKGKNFILSLKQSKNLYRTSDSYQNLKTLENQELTNAMTKDTKYVETMNETNKFTMSNSQDWEIRRKIDCHSVNTIFYLKCKIYNKKEKYIGKTIAGNTNEFIIRINQHISDCKAGILICKLLRLLYDCGIKNNCLQEPFFSLNIMLRLIKSDRLETIEKHFHLKGYYIMNNPGRN